MTKIMYDEKNLTLEIVGHAGHHEPGVGDIVCAGVSFLSQTLLKNLMMYEDRHWYALEWDMDVPGELYIHCKANGYYSMVTEMFRFVMVGFRMLAEKFPENVKIIEQGGE
jgi:uncharacterized protein YsxB (DUF464 family)